MSEADRNRWNERYARGAYQAITHPAALLVDWLPRLSLPAAPRVLDLAAGAGRNSLFLAERGCRVTVVDIADVALTRLQAKAGAGNLDIHTVQLDLDDRLSGSVLAQERFDLVLIMRFWHPAVLADALQLLAPGGYLLAEVHLQTEAAVGGPASDRFRAPSGALRAACGTLPLQHEAEALRQDPDGRVMALASVVAGPVPAG